MSTPGIACLDSSTSTMVHTMMDQACMTVHNADPARTIELWGQSEECFKCSFWPLVTLPPHTNASVLVNTTYATMLSAKYQETSLYGLKAHFMEAGLYQLTLNRTAHNIKELRPPDQPYIPLLFAFLFYAMLFAVWQFARFLRRKMDAPRNNPEATPILSTISSQQGGYGGLSGDASSAGVDDDPTASNPSSEAGGTNDCSNLTHLPSDYLGSTGTPSRSSGSPLEGECVARVSLSERLRSLDVFRGITIFLMIFVNYGGGGYYFFLHSPWNGLTVADLVFPWFMWIMGVSMTFSTRSQLRRCIPRSVIVLKVIKRSLVLFGLGLLVNGISNSFMPTLRIPGVLQRFAGCYLITATLEALFLVPDASEQLQDERWNGWRMFRDIVQAWLQWAVVIGLASIHTVITYVLPVPGCPLGYIGPGGLSDYGTHSNCTGGAASYIDRLVFTSEHMYRGSTARKIYQNEMPNDPEGLLGFLTSMLMVQLGVAAGRILLSFDGHRSRVVRLLVWACTSGLVAGILCNFSKEYGIVPVNKNLWSLSYVLVTSSFAFVLFAGLYALVDWAKVWSGNPVRYAGLNSILLYVGHELTEGIFPFGWTPVGHSHEEHLLMNLWGASLWGFIAYICHKKRIYISV